MTETMSVDGFWDDTFWEAQAQQMIGCTVTATNCGRDGESHGTVTAAKVLRIGAQLAGYELVVRFDDGTDATITVHP